MVLIPHPGIFAAIQLIPMPQRFFDKWLEKGKKWLAFFECGS
jgi:hypothetical protein